MCIYDVINVYRPILPPYGKEADRATSYCVLMTRYGVLEAIFRGMLPVAPVLFTMLKVIYPAVEDAEAPTIAQPAAAAVVVDV